MTAVIPAPPIPDEPPVGTVLTAPGARHFWERKPEGWAVVDPQTRDLLTTAPLGTWHTVVLNLDTLGGILTVTTEYEVTYRFFDPDFDHPATRETGEVHRIDGLRSRGHVARWRQSMNESSNGIDVLTVRSQIVTRSAWTDEPLDEPS